MIFVMYEKPTHIEPDLPKPPRQPTTFLFLPTDRLFVESRLLPSGIEVHNAEKTILGREHVINPIQQGIEIGYLHIRNQTRLNKPWEIHNQALTMDNE